MRIRTRSRDKRRHHAEPQKKRVRLSVRERKEPGEKHSYAWHSRERARQTIRPMPGL